MIDQERDRGHGGYWKHMVSDRGAGRHAAALLCLSYRESIDALDSCIHTFAKD